MGGRVPDVVASGLLDMFAPTPSEVARDTVTAPLEETRGARAGGGAGGRGGRGARVRSCEGAPWAVVTRGSVRRNGARRSLASGRTFQHRSPLSRFSRSARGESLLGRNVTVTFLGTVHPAPGRHSSYRRAP